MKLPRRQFLRLAAGVVALPSVSRVARADTYPAKPVRLMNGFASTTRTRTIELRRLELRAETGHSGRLGHPGHRSCAERGHFPEKVRLAATERPSPGSRPSRLSRCPRTRAPPASVVIELPDRQKMEGRAASRCPGECARAARSNPPLMRSRARWAGIAPVSPFFNSALQITDQSGREPHRYADGTPLRRNSLPASRERPMSAAFQRRPDNSAGASRAGAAQLSCYRAASGQSEGPRARDGAPAGPYGEALGASDGVGGSWIRSASTMTSAFGSSPMPADKWSPSGTHVPKMLRPPTMRHPSRQASSPLIPPPPHRAITAGQATVSSTSPAPRRTSPPRRWLKPATEPPAAAAGCQRHAGRGQSRCTAAGSAAGDPAKPADKPRGAVVTKKVVRAEHQKHSVAGPFAEYLQALTSWAGAKR